MQTRTVEQVESWESRPFSGGFDALHEERDADFTGAVVAGNAWLFMLNGRVVGVFDGSIDDFGEESGTIYTAPHESLPLLFSMQERGGETRAKYFTEDTPLEEADRTLQDANFTGYIELSENVLSGDYYVVYYGGEKMSAAFIGQSERLETGGDAFELAADEVGIFEVKDVSMNITEIPAPAGTTRESAESGAGGAVTGVGSDEDTGDTAESEAGPPAETGTEAAEPDTADVPDQEGTAAPDEADGPDESGTEAAEAAGADSTPTASDPDPGTEETEASDSPGSGESRPDPAGEPDAPAGPGGDSRDRSSSEPTPSSDRDTAGQGTEDTIAEAEPEPETTESVAEDDLQAMFQQEEEWRQTRSIPALDPDQTEGERDEEPDRPPKRETGTHRTTSSSGGRSSRPDVSEEMIEELKTAIDERDRQIDELASSMESVRTERNEMESDLAELRAERDDLEERVSNLESALQRAKDQQAAVDPTATELSREEALSGTNLFVRYDSKGQPTLEALTGGEVDPEAVNANLKLEHHTQFEDENVVVEGEDFEAFLVETSAYRFVSWLVRDLPYELLDSGARSALADLYEAIPKIDRIEFDGTVQVTDDESGSTARDFGVVVRDRMGNPLAVAELNDARDPVRGEEMGELVTAASAIGDVEGSLSGAFYVTASFFEPAALEEAEAAASSGGLFSRSDKASYVKTANKSGFHLCLVEDRADSFHVTVPEL